MKENISFKLNHIELSMLQAYVEFLMKKAGNDYAHKLIVAALKTLHKKLVVKTTWYSAQGKVQMTAVEALALHQAYVIITPLEELSIQSIINKINQAYA